MSIGYVEDTIAAISTPSGAGAIAVLRMSGRDALAVASRMLRKRGLEAPLLGGPGPLESHRARLGRLVSPGGRTIDEVLVLPMLAPRSFTGEDVVEIHCHGGRLVSELALRLALESGARPARPGEFTERAFLNGRLDLCQAEAIADIIEARSEAGLAAAVSQLDGALSRRVEAERDRILDARALVEAHLDFPEDDLPEGVERELVSMIDSVKGGLEALAATFERGRLAREGLRVVLTGKPNVGKSSLLNALLGRDRALVSAEPGTTRDYLEEPLAIGSLSALLYDTAGIREGATELERAGIARSKERIEGADVLVVLLDGSRDLDGEDFQILARSNGCPTVLVRSKADLAPAWDFGELPAEFRTRLDESPPSVLSVPSLPSIDVSAHTGIGLEQLCQAILAAVPVVARESDEGVVITHARHHVALSRGSGHLEAANRLLNDGGALELVAFELQEATGELDVLFGASSTEDVLERVFRRFCIGK